MSPKSLEESSCSNKKKHCYLEKQGPEIFHLGLGRSSSGNSQTHPVLDWLVLGLTHPPDVARLYLVAKDHALPKGGIFKIACQRRHFLPRESQGRRIYRVT